MKSVILILTAMVVMMFTPMTIVSINDFRSRDYTEPHIIATTSSPSADVTLTQKLFSDETSNVVITSNNTADAPLPYAYASSTKTLTISGLHTNDTRLLQVIYRIDALTDYPGAGIAARFWPAFLVLGIIGLIAGAVYTATRRNEG